MRYNKSYFILILLIFTVFACKEKKSVDSGFINSDNIYENKEIGWQMPIPSGWRIMTVDQRDVMNERGKKAIENSVASTVDTDGLKNLLAFQKDKKNIFNSTSQPFAEEYEGEWIENQEEVKRVLTETYEQYGIRLEASDITTENIGGIDFHVFHLKVFLPNNEVLVQYMYSTYINGLDFGVNINYTNEKYGQEMLEAFKKSRFKQKS